MAGQPNMQKAGFANAHDDSPRGGTGLVWEATRSSRSQLMVASDQHRLPVRRSSLVAGKGALAVELQESPSSRMVSIIASPRDVNGEQGRQRGSGNPRTLLGLKGWGKHSHRYLMESEVLIEEPVQRMWFDTLNPRDFSSTVASSNNLPGMQRRPMPRQQQPSSSLPHPNALSTPRASSDDSQQQQHHHQQPARVRAVPKLDFAVAPPESRAHFEARDRVLSYREGLRDSDSSIEIGPGSRQPVGSLTERNLRRVAMDEGRAYLNGAR